MLGSRGFLWLPILLAILGVLAVFGAAYLYRQPHTGPVQQSSVSSTSSTSITINADYLVVTPGSNFVRGTAPGAGFVRAALSQESKVYDLGIQAVLPDYLGNEWNATVPANVPLGTYTLTVTSYSDQDGKVSTGQPAASAIVQVESTLPNYSVPNMSKYTDTDFGFSFWYPSGWTVDEHVASANDKSPDGCSFKKSLSVHALGSATPYLVVSEDVCPDSTMTNVGGNGVNGANVTPTTYNLTKYGTWQATDFSNGEVRPSSATMGGLLMLPGASNYYPSVVVPVSKTHLLTITGAIGADGNVLLDQNYLANTIVAIDPSGITSGNAAEQIKVIQAEKNAYTQ